MPSRIRIAEFLQGLFVLPLCALFGGLVALLFHWQGGRQIACIAFFTLFPLIGAIKTRQSALLLGLLCGALLTAWANESLHHHP